MTPNNVIKDRLLSKTHITNDGCWIFCGASTVSGYGIIRIDGTNSGAHRASYRVHIGPIPEGACVLHKCDNPPCINPEHLFLGTQQDNTQDMLSKGRDVGNKKLSAKVVRDIRKQRLEGCSRNDLARKYAVTYHTIRNIDLNLLYRRVE